MPPLTLVKQNKPAKPMEIPNKTKKGLIKTLIKSVTAACIGYVMFVTLKNGNKVDELEDEIDDLSANADNAAELGAMEDIDGFLVGGAALKADGFSTIFNAIAK